MPSTNEEDVIAIKPRIEGIRYLRNVGKISPLRASLSLVRLTFIGVLIYVLNECHFHTSNEIWTYNPFMRFALSNNERIEPK